MKDVDTLLRTDAERYVYPAPPPLTVNAVTRHSARWLAVAASILIIVAIAAVPVLLHHNKKHATPVAVTQPVPKSITIDGQPAPLLGEVSWTYAITDPADPRTFYVYAPGAGLENCGPRSLRAFATRITSTAVTVSVASYYLPSLCATDVAYLGSAPVRVTLPLSLGLRSVSDRGTPRTLLRTGARPFIQNVPKGYQAQAPRWQALNPGTSPSMDNGYIIETYDGPQGDVLTLMNVRCCPPENPIQDPQPVVINGVSGTVATSAPPGAFLSVEWAPTNTSVLRLQSSGAHHMTIAQLVAVARSVH